MYRPILAPLSMTYSGVMELRNWLFENQSFQVQRVNTPVVSVGNITMGGTGKTPIIIHLIEFLQSKGLCVGVVSRGYGGGYKGVVSIEHPQDPQAAKLFGDEPLMIAQKYPEVPVVVSRKRVLACRYMEEKFGPQVILADDAFQHRWLFRDLDIVLLDALEAIENYRVVPLGRAREGIENLRRADLVVVTRSHLISQQQRQKIEELVNPHFKEKLVFSAEWVGQLLDSRSGVQTPKDIFAFCGIGNPAYFEKSLKDLNLNLLGFQAFGDHHPYTKTEFLNIVKRSIELGAQAIVTTEKDFVRLSHWVKESTLPVLVAPLSLEIREGKNQFYDKISALFS